MYSIAKIRSRINLEKRANEFGICFLSEDRENSPDKVYKLCKIDNIIICPVGYKSEKKVIKNCELDNAKALTYPRHRAVSLAYKLWKEQDGRKRYTDDPYKNKRFTEYLGSTEWNKADYIIFLKY